MTTSYDAIVIGAGHNGLVAAALLARSGLNVLLLEQRDRLGGLAATEEALPGFHFNVGADAAGLLRSEVVEGLALRSHGLELIEGPVMACAPQPDGRPLTLWHDLPRTQAEIARLSATDAERFPAFLRLVSRLAAVLNSIMLLTPPDPASRCYGGLGLRELLPWLRTGLRLRGLDEGGLIDFLRVAPMSVAELLDEWFESEALKGLLGVAGVAGSMQGPMASGTAFMLLYQHLETAGLRSSRFVRGGVGRLAEALADAARQYGVEIRTESPVARIVTADVAEAGDFAVAARGVVLADGQELTARVVLSSADPRRTLFDLVGAPQLEPKIVRRVRNIRFRGSTAKVNLALSGLPRFMGLSDNAQLSGRLVICPSLTYLERAYDDAKYGRASRQPYLDAVFPSLLDPEMAPAGGHVASITVRYAPYHLAEGSWQEETQRQALADQVVETLAAYAPNLPDLILHRQVLTPLDWEWEYGLTEGGIFHGQMALDQLLFMRPIAGYGQYRLPVGNLYLCGAGAHPGGGVTGAPGYNAAGQVLRDLGR